MTPIWDILQIVNQDPVSKDEPSEEEILEDLEQAQQATFRAQEKARKAMEKENDVD